MHKLIRSTALIGSLAVAVFITGCTLIPNDGPSSGGLRRTSFDHVKTRDSDRAETAVNYVLVDVNKRIIRTLADIGDTTFAGSFIKRSKAPEIRIGAGDTVTMTIFEAGSGGLFTPTGVTLSQGNFVTLPQQEVDGSGRIKAPYAGWVQAAGRRVQDIEREIELKLKNRAIEPQVVINVVNRTANLVTVLGDVGTPGRFNIGLGKPRVDRVLDAIGSAGGAKFQDYETLVTLTRGKETATVRLSQVTRNPSNDTYLAPGDVLFVQRDQRFYTIFGATGQKGRLIFDQERLTVADGLAKGFGLSDEIADPRWLVLYRSEARKALEAIGANIPEEYQTATHVPVVYRLNLRDPEGFFFAKHMEMRHADLIYASNAPIIGMTKLNAIITDYSGTINSIKSARDAIANFSVDGAGAQIITGL